MPSEGRQRLFFALWPDTAVRARLARLARGSCERPVPACNLHLTLVFLGSQDAGRRRCLERMAAGLAGTGPMVLELDRLGCFARARVLWLGPSHPPPALGALAGRLASGAAACGIETEKRPFVPHVTLSRKEKNPRQGAVSEVIRWRVGSFVLAESLSARGGVRYEVRARWPL
ncbi:MAG TPA: RNA 2',3'-cyclic phosphodiesterase [Gammaproteobacteria bacterium]|nr:RNA 2',3'-cyclic phosphodiesterase [Gammaproteobacteria bacterium]